MRGGGPADLGVCQMHHSNRKSEAAASANPSRTCEVVFLLQPIRSCCFVLTFCYLVNGSIKPKIDTNLFFFYAPQQEKFKLNKETNKKKFKKEYIILILSNI